MLTKFHGECQKSIQPVGNLVGLIKARLLPTPSPYVSGDSAHMGNCGSMKFFLNEQGSILSVSDAVDYQVDYESRESLTRFGTR